MVTGLTRRMADISTSVTSKTILTRLARIGEPTSSITTGATTSITAIIFLSTTVMTVTCIATAMALTRELCTEKVDRSPVS